MVYGKFIVYRPAGWKSTDLGSSEASRIHARWATLTMTELQISYKAQLYRRINVTVILLWSFHTEEAVVIP